MFTCTMTNTEIQQEARKDFFELSTKIRMAIERFSHRNCDLLNNSILECNDKKISLITKTAENRKWRTRRNNTWTTHLRFSNSIIGQKCDVQYFIYTSLYRSSGTEYIFLSDLDTPMAERFTLHFIERYKERYLKPRNIDTAAMPAPLYFQLHNTDYIRGRSYKPSDIDIEEGAHKNFWIAPEGIYVTDFIDGMLTYITFMDKDDLSPLKQQVYEEEVVWDLLNRWVNKKLCDTERTKAALAIANNPDVGRIFERFAKRNIADNDADKEKTLQNIREQMKKVSKCIQETKEQIKQQEKELLRKNKATGSLITDSLVDDLDIKEYDLRVGGINS